MFGLSNETQTLISDFIKTGKLTFGEVTALLNTPKNQRVKKFDDQIRKRVPRIYQLQHSKKIEKIRTELENYD